MPRLLLNYSALKHRDRFTYFNRTRPSHAQNSCRTHIHYTLSTSQLIHLPGKIPCTSCDGEICHNSMEQNFPEKLTGSELVKKLPHFKEPECSLLHSQAPVPCPYPEPQQSNRQRLEPSNSRLRVYSLTVTSAYRIRTLIVLPSDTSITNLCQVIMSLLSCPLARQHRRIENLHPPGHSMIAAALRDTIKVTPV